MGCQEWRDHDLHQDENAAYPAGTGLDLRVHAAWLLAKFTGLFVYILLGMVALKRGRTRQIRLIAFISAIAVFIYIIGVAVAKSPFSWLAAL